MTKILFEITTRTNKSSITQMRIATSEEQVREELKDKQILDIVAIKSFSAGESGIRA